MTTHTIHRGVVLGGLPVALLLVLGGCSAVGPADDAGDPIDECALCSDKADSWDAPEEGSCGAKSVVQVANEASFEDLDVAASLNRRAVANLVEEREAAPFETLADVDAVPYVGVATLQQLLDYARELGLVDACEATTVVELGIVSDLDKTVVPPAADHLGLPDAPYPGVSTLYRILEIGLAEDGQWGDTTYVTARTPDRVVEMPDWLALHGLPAGTIETGVSGVPWVAQDEKVRDITRTFEASPDQSFVLFGDTSHRDPEAYRAVLAAYPDRVRAGMIHMVNLTVSDSRLVGLHLFDHYPHAAAILVGLDVIDEDDAWAVYRAATDEGLDLAEAEFEALLAAQP